MKIHSMNKDVYLMVGDFTISHVDDKISIEYKDKKTELSRDDAIILINNLERWVSSPRDRK